MSSMSKYNLYFCWQQIYSLPTDFLDMDNFTLTWMYHTYIDYLYIQVFTTIINKSECWKEITQMFISIRLQCRNASLLCLHIIGLMDASLTCTVYIKMENTHLLKRVLIVTSICGHKFVLATIIVDNHIVELWWCGHVKMKFIIFIGGSLIFGLWAADEAHSL